VVESHTLNDGRQVAIRPIGPDDHGRLRASHARLSPESRYRRFLATKPELTSADARYLVEIDGSDHFALVATLPDEPGEPIVAVARYIRLPDDPGAAEYAVVVGDDYQRQGPARSSVASSARSPSWRSSWPWLAIGPGSRPPRPSRPTDTRRVRSSRRALEADRTRRTQGQAQHLL
jgi:hypothetical protein